MSGPAKVEKSLAEPSENMSEIDCCLRSALRCSQNTLAIAAGLRFPLVSSTAGAVTILQPEAVFIDVTACPEDGEDSASEGSI